MSRFDSAAELLATCWNFVESPHEYRERVWLGASQSDQVRTSGGDRQYLRVEHAGMIVTINVPTPATGEAIITLLDVIAEAIGQGGEAPS